MTADLVITGMGALFQGRRFPCAIGRGGIGVKRTEGDGITPRGVCHIEQVWVRPDRLHLSTALPLRATGPRDRWSDDPSDPEYNCHVRLPHPFRSEALRRPDPLYDLVAVLDHNRHPVVPGRGSAVFLHAWRRPRYPTAGCVAFALPDLAFILGRMTSVSRVIIR